MGFVAKGGAAGRVGVCRKRWVDGWEGWSCGLCLLLTVTQGGAPPIPCSFVVAVTGIYPLPSVLDRARAGSLVSPVLWGEAWRVGWYLVSFTASLVGNGSDEHSPGRYSVLFEDDREWRSLLREGLLMVKDQGVESAGLRLFNEHLQMSELSGDRSTFQRDNIGLCWMLTHLVPE